MSLIEQAAKRLQELQRSGAAISGNDSPKADSTNVADEHLPTPEALVHELNMRAATQSSRSPRRTQAADVAVERGKRPSGDSGGVRPYVELDLVRLKEQGFVTPDTPQSQIAHELRVLKRPIIRNAQGRSGTRIANGNLVMVTSSVPGEGKSFFAANLAISLAMELDHTVLLVDGDVAHPSLPGVLGVPSSPGLLDLLTNHDLAIEDVVLRTNIEKLSVLPSGLRHRQATELLASEKMVSFTRELAGRDPDRIVIFDSPPLLATTEARVLASHMGQIVFVVAADSTSKHAVRQALTTIERCEIVLMMLNKSAKTDIGSYYGYYADNEPR
jgi:protein-tyrosine kinase